MGRFFVRLSSLLLYKIRLLMLAPSLFSGFGLGFGGEAGDEESLATAGTGPEMGSTETSQAGPLRVPRR